MKANITYYGTTTGRGRVVTYQCSACDGDLEARDTPEARVLACRHCGRCVGFARKLPKPPMRGQLDIDGNTA